MYLSRRNIMIGATAVTALAARGSAALAQAAGQAARPLFGPAPGIALLSRNENPYGPSPKAVVAADDATKKGAYYADSAAQTLTAMIAERHGVRPEQIVIGTGSGEVLNAIALAWKDKGAYLCPALFWDTTAKYGVAHGGRIKAVPLTDGMNIDLAAMKAATGPDVGLVHIVNPNNPTGIELDGDALRGFIRAVAPGTTVLVDEAYNELVEKPEYSSVVDMVREGHDVIVARTFSKIFGMAGMRIGYSISSAENAARIRAFVMSSQNASGLAAAIASYNDEAFKTYSKGKIVEAREMIADAVRKSGLTMLPGAANFAFVKVADADVVKQAMMEKGIAIRGAYGPWKSWSRVSTGKIEDVARYCKALPEVIGA